MHKSLYRRSVPDLMLAYGGIFAIDQPKDGERQSWQSLRFLNKYNETGSEVEPFPPVSPLQYAHVHGSAPARLPLFKYDDLSVSDRNNAGIGGHGSLGSQADFESQAGSGRKWQLGKPFLRRRLRDSYDGMGLSAWAAMPHVCPPARKCGRILQESCDKHIKRRYIYEPSTATWSCHWHRPKNTFNTIFPLRSQETRLMISSVTVSPVERCIPRNLDRRYR